MQTIIEALVAEVEAEVRPYLALVVMQAAQRRGFNPDKPHAFGQFATALYPAGPDEKVLAVARALDCIYAESDEQKRREYWAGLEAVGVADAVSSALKIAPSYIDRLARAITAASGMNSSTLH